MKKILVLATLICALAIPASSQDAIYLDSVIGLDASKTKIIADRPLEFVINYRCETSTATGTTNGMRFYSPDGATWQPPYATYYDDFYNYFDIGVFYPYFSLTGTGADTIGMSAGALFLPGMPVGADHATFKLYTMVSSEEVGKTLCLDSSFYPPAGVWGWSTSGGNIVPSWNGPYCYEITASCCQGMSGDMNYDDALDITDITYLINWMFKSGPDVYCLDEANVDGVASIDISDLTYFVNYFFKGGTAPVACP